MKKLSFLTAILSAGLFSSTGFSASTTVITALLDSPYAKTISDIHSVEVVNTYRCRNCYDIAVSGTSSTGPRTVLIRINEKGYSNTFDTYLVSETAK